MILTINEETGRVLGTLVSPTNNPAYYERSATHVVLADSDVPEGMTVINAHEYLYSTDGLTKSAELVPLLSVVASRNKLLLDCDWRDLPSYPKDDQDAWREYRQKLRDFTATYELTAKPVWPTPPT